jgi:hypothetical protein
MTSFVLTIKTHQNTEPKRFALESDRKRHTIRCYQSYGPTIGAGHDFPICPQSNTITASYSVFGNTYLNDTGLGTTFLTNEYIFTVKELEVFKLETDG